MGELRHLKGTVYVGEFLREELDARNWTPDMLACCMEGDPAMNLLEIQLMLSLEGSETRDVLMPLDRSAAFGKALDVGPDFLHRLQEMHRASAVEEGS